MNTEINFKKVFGSIYERICNMKISWKLALIYSAVVSICMLSLGAFYYLYISDYIKDYTTDLLARTLQQAKNNIEYKTLIYNNFTDSIYNNKNLQDTLNITYIEPIHKYDMSQIILGQLNLAYRSYEDMNTINLFVTNTSVPSYKDLQITIKKCTEEEVEKYIKYSDAKAEWVYDTPDQVKNGTTRIEPNNYTTDDSINIQNAKNGCLYVLRRLRHNTFDNVLGFIKIDININRFFGGIKTVGLDEKGWIDVTDKNFNKIYSGLNPTKSQENQNFNWKEMENIFEDKEHSKIVEVGNMSYVMVYDILEDTGMYIIYTLPLDDYQRTLNNLKIVTIIAFVLFIIVFTALSGFIASKITKKIRELSTSMERIQIGDFDIHISYKGNDEIGHLIRGFNKMARKLEELIDEVYTIQIKEKESELKALQAQINPHFLYNTLASISWLGMRNGENDITKMSNSLAKFYKVSLSKGSNIIKVRDEIDHVRAYMEIQSIRYKNKIRLEYDIDEQLLENKTIKLIMQPFIENSIMHGIWGEKKSINIRLTVKKAGDTIIWSVIDDGVGISRKTQEQMDQQTNGYGVLNVDERIKLYFGDRYGVSVFSREGIGTNIEIVTPLIIQE